MIPSGNILRKTVADTERTGEVLEPIMTDTVAVCAELMCVKCGKRWDADILLGTRLRDVRCGLCGLTGYVINTGQKL